MSERRIEKVTFAGHASHLLSGVLHYPEKERRAGIILSHCFTCTKDYKVLAWLANELAAKGHSVLRFDFAGLGTSQGEFAATTLSTNVEDLVRAEAWMREQGHPVRTLVGHSLGGAAAILATDLLPSIRTVAVLGTSSEVGRVARILSEKDWHDLETKGEVTVSIGGYSRPIRRAFIEDLKQHSLLETVSTWDKALLVISGTADRVVSGESQEELFRAAAQPKAFFTLPGADHLFANSRHHAVHMANILDEWIQLNRKDETQ
ncbi:MAG: alpha/beta hydrolase [Acidobacteriota bacterium]|nr:MAG: alpha/beta hydrolase [Acidobacteriota bacterium]